MPHRAHLFSLIIGFSIKDCLGNNNYNRALFFKDLLAGISIGIIAIPLAMALAIAIGLEPQHDLYTAIVAGFIIPLCGGSKFSVSGPTAAFVVILYPVVQQYGLPGLLISSFMSGIFLIIFSVLRLGRYIEYISESVVLGFTTGIGIVIAVLQIKDLLGITIDEMPKQFIDKLSVLANNISSFSFNTVLVGMTTLFIMLLWPRFKTAIPPHLPSLILGSTLASYLNVDNITVQTIGSTFHYIIEDGSVVDGIPPFLPEFNFPWSNFQASESMTPLNFSLLQELFPTAFAIAILYIIIMRGCIRWNVRY